MKMRSTESTGKTKKQKATRKGRHPGYWGGFLLLFICPYLHRKSTTTTWRTSATSPLLEFLLVFFSWERYHYVWTTFSRVLCLWTATFLTTSFLSLVRLCVIPRYLLFVVERTLEPIVTFCCSSEGGLACAWMDKAYRPRIVAGERGGMECNGNTSGWVWWR